MGGWFEGGVGWGCQKGAVLASGGVCVGGLVGGYNSSKPDVCALACGLPSGAMPGPGGLAMLTQLTHSLHSILCTRLPACCSCW